MRWTRRQLEAETRSDRDELAWIIYVEAQGAGDLLAMEAGEPPDLSKPQAAADHRARLRRHAKGLRSLIFPKDDEPDLIETDGLPGSDVDE